MDARTPHDARAVGASRSASRVGFGFDEDDDNEVFFEAPERPFGTTAEEYHQKSQPLDSDNTGRFIHGKSLSANSLRSHSFSGGKSALPHSSSCSSLSSSTTSSSSFLSYASGGLHNPYHQQSQPYGRSHAHPANPVNPQYPPRRSTDPWANPTEHPISYNSIHMNASPIGNALFPPHNVPLSQRNPNGRSSSNSGDNAAAASSTSPNAPTKTPSSQNSSLFHNGDGLYQGYSNSLFNHEHARRFSDSWESTPSYHYPPNIQATHMPMGAENAPNPLSAYNHPQHQIPPFAQSDHSLQSSNDGEWALDPALLHAMNAKSSEAWNGFSRAVNAGKSHSSAEQYTRFNCPSEDSSNLSILSHSSMASHISGTSSWYPQASLTRPRSQSYSQNQLDTSEPAAIDSDLSMGLSNVRLTHSPIASAAHPKSSSSSFIDVWETNSSFSSQKRTSAPTSKPQQAIHGVNPQLQSQAAVQSQKSSFTEAQLAAIIETSLQALKSSENGHTIDQVTAAAAAAAAALINGDFAEFTWSTSRQFCEVEFKSHRRDVFSYPSEANIRLEEFVIVEADRGKDLGKVVKLLTAQDVLARSKPHQVQEQPGLAETNCTSPVEESRVPTESILDLVQDSSNKHGEALLEEGIVAASNAAAAKRVLRRAHQWEVHQLSQKAEEEKKSLLICQAKIQQRNLKMEVVDAEYQYDRKKLTFYFTAESRIDFRELVRDLFRVFKARIWMKQMDGELETPKEPRAELQPESIDSTSFIASAPQDTVIHLQEPDFKVTIVI